jgi:hypothetical protein
MRVLVGLGRLVVGRRGILTITALAAAFATPVAIAQPVPAFPSSTTYVTNGDVQAVAVDSLGRVYLGGSFTEVGPRIGHGLSVTDLSDQPAPGWPDVNGEIDAVVSDGAGGWFIAGEFTYVGGLPRDGLAHIDSDGTVDSDWQPTVTGGSPVVVDAMTLSGGSLFVGGLFSSIDGQARSDLAELSPNGDGDVNQGWDPSPDGRVYTLALAGSSLVVGGSFTSIGGESIANLAQVSTTDSGSVDPTWSPDPNASVRALLVSGSELFVGGAFTTIGGQSRAGLAELSATGTGTADSVWNPSPGMYDHQPIDIAALALSGDDLFVAGTFSGMGGEPLNALAEVSTSGAGAAVASWDPAGSDLPTINALAVVGDELYVAGSFSGLGGSSQSDLVRLAVSGGGAADTSWDPNVNGPVDAVGVSGTDLYIGGDFTSAGADNMQRSSLARLNPDGTLDTSWDPNVGGPVSALALVGDALYIGGGFAFVDAVSREGVADVSTRTGGLDQDWNPALGLGSHVGALAASGQWLYIGDSTEGVPILVRAPLSGDGEIDRSWAPALNGQVAVLAVAGSELYVGGDFTAIGGQSRNGIARVSTTGAGLADSAWNPELPPDSNGVGSIALSGTTAYIAGGFTQIGGQASDGFAAVSLVGTGSASSIWQPTFRLNGESGGGVGDDTLAVDGSDLYVGGLFNTVDGVARNNLAALELDDASVDPAWDPDANEGPSTFVTSGAGLVAGGAFTAVGPLSTEGVAVFGDISLPSVALTTPSDGARYTQGQHVSSRYSCSDPSGVVGIASCDGPVAPGRDIDTAVSGKYSFTVTATDADGNTSAQTATYTVIANPPSNRFTILRPFRTARRGHAIMVRIRFPGRGSVRFSECVMRQRTTVCRAERKPTVATGRLSVARPETFDLRMALTRRGLQTIRRQRRLRAILQIAYTPTGGKRATRVIRLTFVAKHRERRTHR